MKSFWTMKKECATCEFWDGIRKITSDPRVVDCEHGHVQGICCGNSSSRGKQVPASMSGCRNYKCWHCLKG